jgi:hypothetical protein
MTGTLFRKCLNCDQSFIVHDYLWLWILVFLVLTPFWILWFIFSLLRFLLIFGAYLVRLVNKQWCYCGNDDCCCSNDECCNKQHMLTSTTSTHSWQGYCANVCTPCILMLHCCWGLRHCDPCDCCGFILPLRNDEGDESDLFEKELAADKRQESWFDLFLFTYSSY